MCDASSGVPGVAVPRPAPGAAVDPIALEPVDELLVTTLVDNVYDALLAGDERTRRIPINVATTDAPDFDGGRTAVGLVAEHGFAALVTVRRGGTTTTLLFDTGLSPEGMLTNADRLGVDLSTVQGVVLATGTSTTRAASPGWAAGSAADGCRWSCTPIPGPAVGRPCPARTRGRCPR